MLILGGRIFSPPHLLVGLTQIKHEACLLWAVALLIPALSVSTASARDPARRRDRKESHGTSIRRIECEVVMEPFNCLSVPASANEGGL